MTLAEPADPPPVFTRRGTVGLAVLLLVSALARVPAVDHGPYGSDPLNYCVAALRTGVAHPPGYAGFVWLGWLLNLPVGHINDTFIALSFASALAAVSLTFALARLMGLADGPSLAAAAAVSFCVGLLDFSTQAMNFAPDCALTLTFACLAVVALRRRSFPIALAATAVFAGCGAIRPTTTAYLFPVWVYVVAATRPTVGRAAAHLGVTAVLIAAWQSANTHLLARAGFHGTTYDFQVMIPASYDYASLNGPSPTTAAAAAASHPTFHMPGFELLAWTLDHLHLRLLPHHADWPQPSLSRAVKLMGVQGAKFAFYLAFSMPLLLLPLSWLHRRDLPAEPGFDRYRPFLLLWTGPVSLFFVLGHLGSIGYTLFLVPALAIWTVRRLMQPGRRYGPPWLRAACWVAPVITLAFFELVRPFRPDRPGWRYTADILALQHTASAARQNYYAARSVPPGPEPASQRAMTLAKDDAAFKAAAVDYSPIPQMPGVAAD